MWVSALGLGQAPRREAGGVRGGAGVGEPQGLAQDEAFLSDPWLDSGLGETPEKAL